MSSNINGYLLFEKWSDKNYIGAERLFQNRCYLDLYDVWKTIEEYFNVYFMNPQIASRHPVIRIYKDEGVFVYCRDDSNDFVEEYAFKIKKVSIALNE